MAIQNNQNALRYNLFGKPNSSVVMKPEGDASGTGAVQQSQQQANPYPTSAPVPQPRTAVRGGGVVKTTPNESGQSDTIQNVGDGGAVNGAPISKGDFVGSMQAKAQPMDYVATLKQQQEAQKNAYVPDAENKGRGVAKWLSNVFRSPKIQTKEGSRRAQQNIAVLGDTLRHLANLWYVGKKDASPQTIQSQSAINDAKWKQEDALEAEKEKAARDWSLKQQQAADKKAYQMGQLALGQERNDISRGNLAINQGRFGLDYEKQGWDREDRPVKQAILAAGLTKNEADAKKATVEADQAKVMGELKQQKLKADIGASIARAAASYASARHSNASTQKVRLQTRQLLKGSGDYVLPGSKGVYSRKKAIDPLQKANLIKQLKKIGAIDDNSYNAAMSYNGLVPDANATSKQNDLIAAVLNEAGDNEFVRDAFESYGFTYTSRKSRTSYYNPKK